MARLYFEHYLVEVWSDDTARWELQTSTSVLDEARATFATFAGQRVRLVRVLDMAFEPEAVGRTEVR